MKRYSRYDPQRRLTAFHGRKVVAPLKPGELNLTNDTRDLPSTAARSWPH